MKSKKPTKIQKAYLEGYEQGKFDVVMDMIRLGFMTMNKYGKFIEAKKGGKE